MAKILHYVEFYYPSAIQPTKIFRIATREVKTLKILTDTYAFRLFDILTDTQNGITMRSSRINVSRIHFIDAQIKKIKDVLEVAGPHLEAQIKIDHWERAVLCNDGEFRQFRRGDCVVMTKANTKKK